MCKALIGQPDRDALVIVDDAHPHRLLRSWRTLQPLSLTTPTLPGSPARCQGFAYPGGASPLAPRTVRSPSPCPRLPCSSAPLPPCTLLLGSRLSSLPRVSVSPCLPHAAFRLLPSAFCRPSLVPVSSLPRVSVSPFPRLPRSPCLRFQASQPASPSPLGKWSYSTFRTFRATSHLKRRHASAWWANE